MCENNAALFRGIGAIDSVVQALCNVPENEGGYADRLRQLATRITTFANSESERAGMLALFAAVCNQGFRDHGSLWSVSKQGTLERHFYMSGIERDNVADLAGL